MIQHVIIVKPIKFWPTFWKGVFTVGLHTLFVLPFQIAKQRRLRKQP